MLNETEFRLLQEQLEVVEQQRDNLAAAIAETTELLGHEGCDADDLRDAVGQLERLLDGKDLDDKLEGVAAQVQRLIQWAHCGSQAFRALLFEGPGRAVTLSQELSEHLSKPLTAEDLYQLTTLPTDGIELDNEFRGLLSEIANYFNST